MATNKFLNQLSGAALPLMGGELVLLWQSGQTVQSPLSGLPFALSGTGGGGGTGTVTSVAGGSGLIGTVTASGLISIASGGIVSLFMASGSVLSGAISSGQVGSSHIASGAVNSGQLNTTGSPNGTLFLRDDFAWAATGGGLTSGAVQSGNIASGAVQGFYGATRHIASGTLGVWDFGSGSVIAGAIGSGSVTSGTIASGQVTTFHLASGAVQSVAGSGGVINVGASTGDTIITTTHAGNDLLFEINGTESFRASHAGGVAFAGNGGAIDIGNGIDLRGRQRTLNVGGVDVNDYDPGQALNQKWSASAPINVTGMNGANYSEGTVRFLWNVGTNPMTLSNQNAGSAAANRWITTTGADILFSGNRLVIAMNTGGSGWRAAIL